VEICFQFPVMCRVNICCVPYHVSVCSGFLIVYTSLTNWLFPMLFIGERSGLCKRFSHHTLCSLEVWFCLIKCADSRINKSFCWFMKCYYIMWLVYGVVCCKWTHTDLPTDNLEEKQIPFATYTLTTSWWWVTNGPKTCRGMVIQ
jgi:hypothetical protein